MRASSLLTLLISIGFVDVDGATLYKHKWDKVADLMGMHGQGGSSDASAIDFAANNYAMITVAAKCSATGPTIEDGTLALVASIKAANPAALVGMYWRTDMALEIALCSNFTAELKTHGNDYFLRDDNGKVRQTHLSYDFLATFFKAI